MKKLLPFSLIINAVLIIGAVMMIFGPVIGNTYSSVNSELPGVGGGAPSEYYAAAPLEDYSESADLQQFSPRAVTVAVEGISNNSVPVASAVERIVIKNADLAIVVSDVEGRMKNIQSMAEQMGGFVVSSNLYQSYTSNSVGVPEAQIVIRVPSEKLKEAMDQIKKDVVEVQNETTSGQDVTAEYVDLKSRLKNLEAAEAQLDEILQSATVTEDVVVIFNQLAFYREQIEMVKGQIKYYDEASALSAISVSIIAEETIQPIEIGGWEPKGVARDAIQDLLYFWQNFVNFLIRFFLKILPQWITIGIPLYLVFIGGRALYRKMGRKKVEDVEVEKK
ncbi:MAG: DUF4349 domain-containing protein [Chloroflexi bacterium]|nr:DUF4349 domain-containing protein [Chloroflexota bacterium]